MSLDAQVGADGIVDCVMAFQHPMLIGSAP